MFKDDHVTDSTHDIGCRFCAFLPPYIARRLANSDDRIVRSLGIDTIEASAVARTQRRMQPARVMGRSPSAGASQRTVFDMEGMDSPLPGTLRRSEGSPATGQAEVDQAYDNAGATRAFYRTVLGRESLDGAGYPLDSSVNFGFEFANALWDGKQMVYGAGDGNYFLPIATSNTIANPAR